MALLVLVVLCGRLTNVIYSAIPTKDDGKDTKQASPVTLCFQKFWSRCKRSVRKTCFPLENQPFIKKIEKVARTGVGSVAMIYLRQPVVELFLADADEEFFNGEINSVCGAFLSVVGLVYGLVVAQLMQNVFERFWLIREMFSEEVAIIHHIKLLLTGLPSQKREEKDGNVEMARILFCYIDQLDSHKESFKDIPAGVEELYFIVPMLAERTEGGGRVEEVIATRALDGLKDVLDARYHRGALEKIRLSPSLWICE